MADPVAEGASADERLHELATGWSSGDLDEAGQRELLARLQGPEAARDAQVVWQHLDTAIELKCGLSPVLTDSVKLRIARAGSNRFVNEARRRMGAARPGLAPTAEPPASVRRRGLRLAVILAMALAVAGVGTWLVLRRKSAEEVVATVVSVDGAPTLSGEALAAGAPVDPRSLVVPGGARLELAWPDGARAELVGPAMAVAQSGGIALQAGAGRFASAREMRVGLPDRQLRLLPGVAVGVAIDGTRSTVGCAAGAVEVGGHALAAGEAVADGDPFPWKRVDALPAAADAGLWRAGFEVRWHGDADRVALRLDADNLIELRPGWLSVRGRERSLPGAPMGDVRLELAWRRPHLVIRLGQEEVLAADLPALAPQVQATGAEVAVSGFTGPLAPR